MHRWWLEWYQVASKDWFRQIRLEQVMSNWYVKYTKSIAEISALVEGGRLLNHISRSFLISFLVSTMDMRRARRLTSISPVYVRICMIIPIQWSDIDNLSDWDGLRVVHTKNSWSCGCSFRSVKCSMPEQALYRAVKAYLQWGLWKTSIDLMFPLSIFDVWCLLLYLNFQFLQQRHMATLHCIHKADAEILWASAVNQRNSLTSKCWSRRRHDSSGLDDRMFGT